MRVFRCRMNFVASIVALALASSAVAQYEEASEGQLDLQTVQELREQAVENPNLEDEVQKQLTDLHGQAIGHLKTAEKLSDRVVEFQKERSAIGERIDSIRSRLDKLKVEPARGISDESNAEQIGDLLNQETARLHSLRETLREVENLAEERTTRRVEIAERLGVLGEEFNAIGDEIRSISQLRAPSELKQATRIALLARRRALSGERESLRAELELVEARSNLIPWQRDLAEGLVGTSEDLVALLEQTLLRKRQEDAARSLEQVREQTRLVEETVPNLLEIAQRTELYAGILWGSEGVIVESSRLDTLIVETRRFITQLERIAQLTRRRFEAVGHRGDITQWWPDMPEDFPRTSQIRQEISRYEQLIPNVQYQLIQLEQERAGFLQFEREVRKLTAALEAKEAEEDSTEVRDLRRTQVHMRRAQLDTLIIYYTRYSGELVENLALMKRLLLLNEELSSFLYERALWGRSVPGSALPDIRAAFDALLWFHSSARWSPLWRLLRQYVLDYFFQVLIYLVILGLLVGYRNRIKNRIELLAAKVNVASNDSFSASLKTLFYTVLLAVPFPLTGFLLGRILLLSNYTPFLSNVGQALIYVSFVSGLFELTRQCLRPEGFAESHLNWSRRIIRPVYQGLIWPQIIFLPLLFLSLQLALSDLSLEAGSQLQNYSNSLGRICFSIAMIGLGLFLGGAFRPRDWRYSASRRVGLYGAPFVFLSFFLPAILALMGFYITGLLLSYQMLQTALLVLCLMLLGGVFFRWLQTSRRRLIYRSEKRASIEAMTTSGDQVPIPQVLEQEEEDLEIAEARSYQLVRFMLILLGALGLYVIWAEALPMLQILKRVQVWPAITLMEPIEESNLIAGLGGESATSSSTRADIRSTDGTGQFPIPASAESVAEHEPTGSVLTVWNLLQAMLAAFITAVLVKNIPGALELGLLKRTMLDRGARIALSLLVRYVIMIIGVVVTFNLIGIGWSKVQWLAAALTFGLGFGLQEIVANFVSGLILLVERPVRVGDAVKIGDFQGLVSRTQIRATTITLWNRSEMVVPNKEFITGKLINWTLSDSRRRIEIPVRVAYGTEVQEVKRVLLEVANKHPDVLDDPSPRALLLDLGEDALKFQLWVYVEFGKGLTVKDELLVAIDQAFKENAIEFALPQLSIRIPEKPDTKQ